jgi:hypothetical protein
MVLQVWICDVWFSQLLAANYRYAIVALLYLLYNSVGLHDMSNLYFKDKILLYLYLMFLCICIIDAAPPEQMLSAEVLSGEVVFETSFYDGDLFLCKNSVRIYYV